MMIGLVSNNKGEQRISDKDATPESSAPAASSRVALGDPSSDLDMPTLMSSSPCSASSACCLDFALDTDQLALFFTLLLSLWAIPGFFLPNGSSAWHSGQTQASTWPLLLMFASISMTEKNLCTWSLTKPVVSMSQVCCWH